VRFPSGVPSEAALDRQVGDVRSWSAGACRLLRTASKRNKP